MLKQFLMAQGRQVPCLLSALSEYAREVFRPVLCSGYRAPWKELRCTPNWFFYSYFGKFKLCDETVSSRATLAITVSQFFFFLKESLKSSGISVELLWNT